MPNGANSVHKQLRTELENYIKSQYFGKSPILLSALNNHIDDEGLLYQRPFIESSPAYVTVQNGIETAYPLGERPPVCVFCVRIQAGGRDIPQKDE